MKDTVQLKILWAWIYIHANSFLGKCNETKIGEGTWEIIGCTQIRVLYHTAASIKLYLLTYYFNTSEILTSVESVALMVTYSIFLRIQNSCGVGSLNFSIMALSKLQTQFEVEASQFLSENSIP